MQATPLRVRLLSAAKNVAEETGASVHLGGLPNSAALGHRVTTIGEEYKVMIAPARDGANGGYVMTWTLPDGTKMDFWHDYGDGSTEKP